MARERCPSVLITANRIPILDAATNSTPAQANGHNRKEYATFTHQPSDANSRSTYPNPRENETKIAGFESGSKRRRWGKTKMPRTRVGRPTFEAVRPIQTFAHAKLRNRSASNLCRFLKIILRTGRHISEDHFLGHPPAKQDINACQQLGSCHEIAILRGELLGIAQSGDS